MSATGLRKRLVRGGVWVMAVRLVGISSSFAVNALLARMLSVTEMGAYFLALSLAGFMVLIAQFGMPQTIVRLVAESMSRKEPGQARLIIISALGLCLGIGAIISLGFDLFGGSLIADRLLHSRVIHESAGLIALMIMLMSLQGMVAETFRGFHDVRLASIYGGVATTFLSMVMFSWIWFTHGHSNLSQAFETNLLALAMALLVSGSNLWRRLAGLGKGNGVPVSRILASGWPVCVINLSVFIATQGDLWVVGAFLPHQDAAVYGAVLRLMQILTMTQVLVVATFQSTVAELHANGETQRMESIVRGLTFWLCMPAGILLLLYILWGSQMLGLIFGQYYRAGYWPLVLLCSGQFLGMLFGPVEMVLIMTGWERPLMWLIVATGLIGIGLAIMLVKPLGLVGISLSWAIMAVLQGTGAWLMVLKLVGIKCHVKRAPFPFTQRKEMS